MTDESHLCICDVCRGHDPYVHECQYQSAMASRSEGIEHLRLLWEENVRELADDPNDVNDGDTLAWIADLEASAPLVGHSFWAFVEDDPEISEYERKRLRLLRRSPTETSDHED